MTKLTKKILQSLVVCLCAGGLTVWYGYSLLVTPSPVFTSPVIVFVPAGTTLQATARQLASNGLLTHPRLFVWWARVTGADRQMKSGEYRFLAPPSPLALLRTLTQGAGLRHQVTIPEGMTFRQIASLLATHGLGAEEHFLCLNADPRFLATWGLPPQGIEGYLYPDTYQFSWLASPEEILGRMIERFYAAIQPVMHRRAAELGLSLHQTMTMASLIEKETGAAAERPRVAAVFHNRLQKGMRLQCDPTVIYGLNELFDGNLTRRHLRTPTPYNTYLFAGLPPGPIASPGLAAIQAALYPERSDVLYFVARGDGTHVFSSNLADHNRAVQRFQRGRS